MCLGMQNDQDGSRQQSVKKGGNVVQVQSQKGTASLGRCALCFGMALSLGSGVYGH